MKCENKKCNATFKQRGVGVTQKRFCSKKCRAANCRARKVLARKALSVSQIERKLGISTYAAEVVAKVIEVDKKRIRAIRLVEDLRALRLADSTLQ
jgi:SOS response regulatory protein OraA/RecX